MLYKEIMTAWMRAVCAEFDTSSDATQVLAGDSAPVQNKGEKDALPMESPDTPLPDADNDNDDDDAEVDFDRTRAVRETAYTAVGVGAVAAAVVDAGLFFWAVALAEDVKKGGALEENCNNWHGAGNRDAGVCGSVACVLPRLLAKVINMPPVSSCCTT